MHNIFTGLTGVPRSWCITDINPKLQTIVHGAVVIHEVAMKDEIATGISGETMNAQGQLLVSAEIPDQRIEPMSGNKRTPKTELIGINRPGIKEVLR